MSFVNNEGAEAWELGDAIRIPAELDGPDPDETESDADSAPSDAE